MSKTRALIALSLVLVLLVLLSAYRELGRGYVVEQLGQISDGKLEQTVFIDDNHGLLLRILASSDTPSFNGTVTVLDKSKVTLMKFDFCAENKNENWKPGSKYFYIFPCGQNEREFTTSEIQNQEIIISITLDHPNTSPMQAELTWLDTSLLGLPRR